MITSGENIDLGQFECIKRIGKGGFGEVYLIEDKKTKEKYAAKKIEIDESKQSKNQIIFLFREVKIMSALDHPSILRYIGYSPIDFDGSPTPIIILEYISNGSLNNILRSKKKGQAPQEWNDTKQLICLYGIASGMSYLHSNSIIHRDLKPDNILLDNSYYPKITDFGLSKAVEQITESLNIQTEEGLKGSLPYIPPEIFQESSYSKEGDIYAFGIIVNEIYSGHLFIVKGNPYSLIQKVIKGQRPEISKNIPESIANLIEKCWSQNPKDRPSFDEIIVDLKTNKDFITDNVDEEEFLAYVKKIDSYKSSFDIVSKNIHLKNLPLEDNNSNDDDSIEDKDEIKVDENDENDKKEVKDEKKLTDKKAKKDKTKEESIEKAETIEKVEDIEKVENDKKEVKDDEEIAKEKDKKVKKDKTKEEKSKIDDKNIKTPKKVSDKKIEVKKSPKKIIYPIEEAEKLDENCRKLVKEAEKNIQKQFLVGKHLINGDSNFTQNVQLGIKYLRQSSKNGCNESSLYLSKLYIEGEIVPEDIDDAKEILNNIEDKDDGDYLLLIGIIDYKKNKFKRAFKNMKKAAKLGNPEAMYRLGKMYLKGEGIEEDESKANQYFELAKKNGYEIQDDKEDETEQAVTSTSSSSSSSSKHEITKSETEKVASSETPSKVKIIEPVESHQAPSSEKHQKVTIIDPLENQQDNKNDLSQSGSQYNFPLRMIDKSSNEARSQVFPDLKTFAPKEQSTSPTIEINMTFIGDRDDLKHNVVNYLTYNKLPENNEELPELIDGAPITKMNYFGENILINLVENKQIENSYSYIYYKFTNIFVMVYSMIDKSTLYSLNEKWKNEIKDYRKNTYVVLMGTELDKWYEDQNNENYVTQDDIKNSQKIINTNMNIKCSYITGENIKDFKNKIIGSYIMKFYNPDEIISTTNPAKEEEIKILLVGNFDGGQYQLINYIKINGFNSDLQLKPISKVDKIFTYKKKNVKNLHFFSTPGDPKCQKIRYMAYSDTNIVLLVFSLTNPKSLISLISNYYIEVQQFASNSTVILVGVDVENWDDDKTNLSIVHNHHIQSFMQTSSIQTFIKCSYVTGENMENFIEKIIDTHEEHKKMKKKRRFSLFSPKK